MTPAQAVEALISKGLTESGIACLAGVRQSTVNRIKRGRMQPSYDIGKALVDLAAKVNKQDKSKS